MNVESVYTKEGILIEGLKLVTLKIFSDSRGFFTERFRADLLLPHGISPLAQDNHSRSVPKVVRGLHIQYSPPQAKLVSCVRGKILDVAVDLRKNSPTFGKYFSAELTDENGKMLWIPHGFAHGFCVLGDTPADVLYKVDVKYNAEGETGILWNDPDLGIAWPSEVLKAPIVSDKDQKLQSFKEYCSRFSS